MSDHLTPGPWPDNMPSDPDSPPPPPKSVPPLPGSGSRGAPPSRPVGARHRGNTGDTGSRPIGSRPVGRPIGARPVGTRRATRGWGDGDEAGYPRQTAKKKSNPAGAVIAIIVIVLAVVGAIGGLASKPDKEFGTSVTGGGSGGEFAESPGAGLQSISPAERQQMEQLAGDTLRLIRFHDPKMKFDNIINHRRMAWEGVLQAPAGSRKAAEKQFNSFAQGMRTGMMQEARQSGGPLGRVDSVHLHRVELVTGRPEAIGWFRVFIDDLDGSGIYMIRLVAWFIRGDNGWRVFDLCIPDDRNVRISAVVGSLLAAGLGKSMSANVRVQGSMQRFDNLVERYIMGQRVALTEIDTLIADPNLRFGKSLLQLIRLASLMTNQRPPSEVIGYANQLFAAPDCLPATHLTFADWQFTRATEDDIAIYESAVEHYRTYIELVGPDPTSSLSLGNALTWLDKWDEALEAWEQWVEVAHEPGHCHVEAARVHADYGRVAETLELLGALAKAPAHHASVVEILDALQESTSREQYPELIEFLSAHEASFPDGCRMTLCMLLIWSDRQSEAIPRLAQIAGSSIEHRTEALDQLNRCGDEGATETLQLVDRLIAANKLPRSEAWQYRGPALEALGRIDDARADYEAAIAGGRVTGDDLLTALRKLYFTNGIAKDDTDEQREQKRADAARAFLAVLDRLPAARRPAGSWWMEFDAFDELGERDSAIAVLQRAAVDKRLEEDARSNAVGRLLNSVDDAEAVVLELLDTIDADPELAIEGTIGFRGTAMERLGRIDEVRALYRAVILDSGRPMGDREIALRRLREHQLPQLMIDLFEQLEADDSALRDPRMRADCLIELGRIDEAAKLLASIASDQEEHLYHRRTALQTMIRHGHAKQVLALLETITRGMEPDDAIDMRFIEALATAADGRPAEAVGHCLAVLNDEVYGDGYEYQALSRLLEIQPGGPEAVLAHLDKQPAAESIDESPWRMRGRALRALGRETEALALYEEVVAKTTSDDYDHDQARQEILITKIETGDTDGAVELAAKLVDEVDEWERDDYQLLQARALVAAGRTDDARTVLTALRESEGDDLIGRIARGTYYRDLWRDEALAKWLREWHIEETGLPPRISDDD